METRESSKTDLWRTAIHEAGHAVVARALGLSSGQATIVPDFDLEEAGHHITPSQWKILDDWEKRGLYRHVRSAVRGRIIAYMAGAEAEVELLGECAGGDCDDRDKIEDMADSDDSCFNPEEWKRYERRMSRQTRRIVKRHRAKIEWLANALMERGTLKGEEIDRLSSAETDGRPRPPGCELANVPCNPPCVVQHAIVRPRLMGVQDAICESVLKHTANP